MPTSQTWYAGLDIGTSSTKVLLIDRAGTPTLTTSRSYPLHNPEPGFAEQDPEVIFHAVLFALKEAVDKIPPEIVLGGIGISSAMHSFLMVDQEGKPLTPMITWADTRSSSIAAQLKDDPLGIDIYRHTGTPIHSMSPLCKAAWFNTHFPELLGSAHKVLSIKEYVTWKMFNQYLVDHSIASATGLFDIRNCCWYQPAITYCGLREDQLSVPVPTTHILQGINREIALQLGIESDVPFVIGASDGCLANLGVGVVSNDEAALTIGTSGAIRVTTPKPITDPERRLFTYILDQNRYVIGGSINNGAIVLEWFRTHLIQHENAMQSRSIEQLLEQTRPIPAGSEGLICLPYLLGERAPHWNGYDKGVFFGVQYHHTGPHFLKAIIEGVSLTLLQIAKAIQELCDPIRIIKVSGGFARSPEWLQILADVFQKELVVNTTYEASATGAALLVMEAIGIGEPFRKKGTVSPTHVYPDSSLHSVYQEAYALSITLYDKLQPDFVDSNHANF